MDKQIEMAKIPSGCKGFILRLKYVSFKILWENGPKNVKLLLWEQIHGIIFILILLQMDPMGLRKDYVATYVLLFLFVSSHFG
mmetsp:Transcript_55367/g.66680  ORF Transcript_55367/g.66680 Transcript_55367/m.66680 type:complete len:83 (+) Transcript_55367:4520-4768(+)